MERKLWSIYIICFAVSASAWWITQSDSPSKSSQSPGDALSESPPLNDPMLDIQEPARQSPSLGPAGPDRTAVADALPEGIERFSPPADGRLRLEHLEMFTRIASRARRGLRREANEAMVQYTEARAAQALGYDPRGFRWAQARIHLALLRAQRAEQRASSRALRAQMREQIESLRESAPSEDARRRIDAQLASMQTSFIETEPGETDTERHNRQFVLEHRDMLTAALRFGVAPSGPILQVIEEDSVSNNDDEQSAAKDEEFLPLEPEASSQTPDETSSVAEPSSPEFAP
ncbi:MAG: hypothetical protein AAFP04_10850 [Myxococcota bacterium]